MELVILVVILLGGLTALVFLLGIRLGGEHWQAELARVRLEAAQAERRLHDLTRQAFMSMAEEVQKRRLGQ